MKQWSIFQYNQKGWEQEFFVATTLQAGIMCHDASDYIGIGAEALNDDFSSKSLRLGCRDKDVTVLLEPKKELGAWSIENTLQENLQYLYGNSLAAAIKAAHES